MEVTKADQQPAVKDAALGEVRHIGADLYGVGAFSVCAIDQLVSMPISHLIYNC